jgi:glycosyltransferase involved in cell wall biosynthesis
MTSRNILIVSGAALSRNPRVLKEATALADSGHDVTLLTLRNHTAAEAFDREIMATARFKRLVVDVTPAPGASAAGVFLRRLKAAATRRAARHLGWESIETIGPARELLALARRQRADLVIGHTEVGLWVAAQLLAEGRRVGVDLEDWHSEDLLPEDRKHRPVKLLQQVESSVLRRSACAFTTSEAMADAFVETYGCPRPVVVRNVFPLQPASRIDRPSGAGPVNFIWFSQTVGPGRGLEEFLELWKRTSVPSTVHLLGECRDGYLQKLTGPLEPARRQRILNHPPVPPGELPQRLSDFDIGLALELRQPRSRDLTITNKLFQYLNAGLAVVASDTSGQREIMDRIPAAGLCLAESDLQSKVKLFDAFLADPDRIHAAQLAARAAAEREYCWEKEQSRLLEAVARALHR